MPAKNCSIAACKPRNARMCFQLLGTLDARLILFVQAVAHLRRLSSRLTATQNAQEPLTTYRKAPALRRRCLGRVTRHLRGIATGSAFLVTLEERPSGFKLMWAHNADDIDAGNYEKYCTPVGMLVNPACTVASDRAKTPLLQILFDVAKRDTKRH